MEWNALCNFGLYMSVVAFYEHHYTFVFPFSGFFKHFFFYKFSLWQKANTHECCLQNLSRKPLFIAPAHSYLSMHCVGYPAFFKFAKVWINLEYNLRTLKVSGESKIERKRKKEYWPITPKVIAMANENNSPSTIRYRWPNVTILGELCLNLLFLLFHIN